MTTLFENLFSNMAPQEDEYLNEEDGLIYCSRCHTPRQTRVETMGQVYTPPVMCKCRRDKYEQEQAERKRREFLTEVSCRRSAGLQDKALYEYTFANDLGYNPEMEKAHAYVDNWEEMRAKSMGLLLWGDVGTGKSFFAGCIANALLDQCVPVLMTNFAKILSTLTGMYAEDRNRYIESLNAYSLLIIDDLGVERNSEFALEQVFHVIDSRYRSKKPMIVTTNLTLAEIKHPDDLAHARIYDRILERCVPICISNQNIREINAAANLAEAKSLLDTGKEPK